MLAKILWEMFMKHFLENLELLPLMHMKPEKSRGREGNNLLGISEKHFCCAFWTNKKFSHENERFHPSFVMLYMWNYSVSLEVARVFSHINWRPCFNITGKWLGSRQIRCNWAAKGASSNDDKQNLDSKSVVELTNGTSGALTLNFFFFGGGPEI